MALEDGVSCRGSRSARGPVSHQAAAEDDAWNSLTFHTQENVVAFRVPQLQARCSAQPEILAVFALFFMSARTFAVF